MAPQETTPLQETQAAFAALVSGRVEQSETKTAESNSAQNAQTPGPATTASTQPVVDAQFAIPAQGLLQQSSAPQKAAAGSAAQDIAQIGTTSTAGANTAPTPSGAGVRAAGFDFANQLSAMRAAKTAPTATPQAIEQVAVQLNKMAKDGQDEITIHLKPVDLGKIEIKLEIHADKTVQGTIVAESQSTLNLLSKDAGSLQKALLDAGLQADMGSLSFSLKGDGQNAFAQQNASNRGMSFAMSSDSADELSQLAAATANDDAMLALGRVNLRV
jgi:flagellar hook-length control protein FliK